MKRDVATLLDIYRQLYGSKITIAHLDELAQDLSQIAGRSRPWTGKFLHSLIKGYPGFKSNGQLRQALDTLAARLVGHDEVKASAKETTVLTVHSLPAGTVVLGQPQRCARPGCPVWFVPTHPRQKYHSKSCRKSRRRPSE